MSPNHPSTMNKQHCLACALVLCLATSPLHATTGTPAASAGNIEHALHWGNAEELEALLASGADLNARDKQGRAPLHYVARYANNTRATGEWLIEHGADIHATDSQSNTALHEAMFRRWSNVNSLVTLLLERGLDINAKNNEGNTPLHLAAMNGCGSVPYLLSKGANPHAVNKAGETPLSATLHLRQQAVEEYAEHQRQGIENERTYELISIMDSTVGTLADLYQFQNLCGIIDKLEQGASPQESGIYKCDENGDTLLHEACSRGYVPQVKALLEHGVDANTKGGHGDTPLQRLIKEKATAELPELVELLESARK